MARHEPYLQQHLAKYSYKDLVKRDCGNLLQVYRDLRPNKDSYVFNDGTKKELLSLVGTIPVNYKGQQYNIPICIWLMETHPHNAPMVFVKPTSGMLVKPSKHVDANGRVYMPYLHEWRHPSSDLVSLVQVLCAIFDENSPVYSRGNANGTRGGLLGSRQYSPYPGLTGTSQYPSPSYPGGRTGTSQYRPYPGPYKQYEIEQRHESTSDNAYQPGRGVVAMITNNTGTVHNEEEDIRTVFENTLNFTVFPAKKDLTRQVFIEYLKKVSDKIQADFEFENAECSSLIVFINSYFGKDGIRTQDGNTISFNEIVSHFDNENLAAMADKPKIFVIHSNENENDSCDDRTPYLKLTPKNADILLVTAVSQDAGPSYTQYVCQMITERYQTDHLIDIFTLVNGVMDQCSGSEAIPKNMSQMITTFKRKFYLTSIS